MNEKKKLSFGTVWIIVCVAAVVLGLLVAYFGLLAPEMSNYNNHVHYNNGCYAGYRFNSDCIQDQYESAFAYAAYAGGGYFWFILFGGGALILANIVMVIIYAARKVIYAVRKTKAVNPQNEQITPVSIPAGEGEQRVLERHYPAVFPVVMIVLGILSALAGLVVLMDDDEVGTLVLVAGLVFIIVGFLLRKAMKIHLVVTTKRVYVKAPFASRCNLPLNRISAVGTGLFRYLKITSAAGRAGSIHLFLVPKYLEVYNTVNALLNEVE